MIILFDETDLASFGSYLLSDERTKSVEESYDPNNGITKEQWKKTITSTDLQTWSVKVQNKQQQS